MIQYNPRGVFCMISFKVQTYLYDLLQYLNINKKENYNLIKKFQEIIPFLQYIVIILPQHCNKGTPNLYNNQNIALYYISCFINTCNIFIIEALCSLLNKFQ